MHMNLAHRLASRTSTWHVWLRLTLAAFVLAVYTSIALASGVAHADDDTSASGHDAGAAGASTSQPSAATSSGSGSPSDNTSSAAPRSGAGHPPRRDGDTARTAVEADSSASDGNSPRSLPNRRPAAGRSIDSTTSPTVREPAERAGPSAPEPQHTGTTGTLPGTPQSDGARAQGPSSATVGATMPDTTVRETTPPTVGRDVPAAVDTIEADTTPVTPRLADVPHDSKRSEQPASTATQAAQPPAASVAPSVRSLRSAAGSGPATASLAAVAPSDPVPSIQPRLDLQLDGLAVDVGTITVSAVHAVAATVAQVFGPTSFFGAPYLLATTVANAAVAVGGTLVGASQFAPATGPFTVTYGILDGLAFLNPTTPPAGANDPSITVTPEHPLPIILINGTTATQGANWSVGAPILANAGYKVYTFNYGNTTADPNFPIQAIGDIRQSGLELSAEVDRVIAETGAPKVILVGHSQGGGILPVYYINDLGGAAKVSQLIGISPSNHGTDLDGLLALQSIPILGPLVVGITNAIAPAGYQQAVGSPFQQEVYGDGDTRPGVLYTTIASINDEVVTPYTQQALSGPNVTNIVLQDRYPGLVVGHANIFTSPQAFALVLEALASNPAANPLTNQTTVAA